MYSSTTPNVRELMEICGFPAFFCWSSYLFVHCVSCVISIQTSYPGRTGLMQLSFSSCNICRHLLLLYLIPGRFDPLH